MQAVLYSPEWGPVPGGILVGYTIENRSGKRSEQKKSGGREVRTSRDFESWASAEVSAVVPASGPLDDETWANKSANLAKNFVDFAQKTRPVWT